MKIRTLSLLASHLAIFLVGFTAGIYWLPILTAPPPADAARVLQAMQNGEYAGSFARDRQDSDAFHWGEGTLTLGNQTIAFDGELAPGPDYRLYLSPEFVETEADFLRLKSQMVQVAEVKSFDRFVLPLAGDVDPGRYNTAIVWCEAFGQFITSARYSKRPS